MKKVLRSIQVLTIVLVSLALSSVFFGVESVWASDEPNPLSMSTVEDVTILENGGAQLALLINVAATPLADMYRKMLAAPSDAGVSEEMPIPQNRTENGGVVPVRQEFYRSIKQEQTSSFGFTTWILNSSMVPRGEQNEFRVSINAYALLQVVNFTAVGSDGIWEIVVGPNDENATAAAAGLAFTSIAFAKQMLESLEGDQVYEVSKTVRIKVPVAATLLNGDELAGLSWTVSFGGGTSMSASVSLDGPSTVVLSERTVVTEQNITATSTDVFEAFRGYKVFKVRYLLPNSTWTSGESAWTSDSDWHCDWSWAGPLPSIPVQWTYSYGVATLTATLTITPSFTFSGYLGWDFNWRGKLEWFKAWIGASASLRVRLEVTAEAAFSKYWEDYLLDYTLYTFYFAIDWVPVWIDLDFSLIGTLTVNAGAELKFTVEAEVGASFKGGVKYDDSWSVIKEADAWASLTEGPTITAKGWASIEPSLKIRVSFMVYGVAGPYIEVQPYVTGTVTWYYPDDVTLWNIACGIRLNAGVTFRGWLNKLLDLSDHWFTLFDWTIKSWSGHWGLYPSNITCKLDYNPIGLGSGTWVRGQISYAGSIKFSEFPRAHVSSKSGTVFLNYSNDAGANWYTIGQTTSSSSGEYSKWWVPPAIGTYLVYSYWEGNDNYKGDTSDSVTLEVSLVAYGLQEYFFDSAPEPPSANLSASSSYWDPHGCAVRFTTPVENWLLQKIYIYGYYTGGDGKFVVEVWDSKMNRLFCGDTSYKKVFGNTASQWQWAELDIGDWRDWNTWSSYSVLVSGDYYVCVFPNNAENMVGHVLWIGLDKTSPDGRSYAMSIEYVGLYRKPKGIDYNISDVDVMIHAVGQSLVTDHCMTKDVPPIPTDTFYTDDGAVVSWVNFSNIHFWHRVKWEWYIPNGLTPFQTTTTEVLAQSVEEAYDRLLIEGDYFVNSSMTPILDYRPYLGKTFTVKVYFGTWGWGGVSGFSFRKVLTENWRIIKHEGPSTLFSIFPDRITLGKSTQLYSAIPVSGGTLSFEYSTDNVTWFNIASGTPLSSAGTYYLNYTWAPPHAGTYSLRAVWSGNPDYYDITSVIDTLTVDPAPTSLTTTLSENTITYGSTVTITASMTPALQGRSVTIQYSNDSTIWYSLGLGTTDSLGQCAYVWSPPNVGTYYIRSTWYGDADYLGANSTIETLTVTPPAPTSVEIAYGADAEVDRTLNATVEFGVKVKDLVKKEYLNGTGRVEFYVSDLSHYNIIFAGSDNDTDDADGIYHIQWNASSWPTLGPQQWSAWFTGTPQYNASLASSSFTIYYYGVAIWIDPTFQAVNVTQSKTYTINLKWNRDQQEDNFTLSLNGLDSSWYNLSQTIVTLSYQGQTKQVNLTISPPNAPTILTDYEFTVTATSQEDPTFSVSASATIRVEFTPTLPLPPTGDLTTAVQPKTSYTLPGTKIIINILVTNNQNFDDVITIDIRNTGIQPQYQANLTWFNWLRVKVFLPTGASIDIPLEIEVPSDTPLGTYNFRAVATSTTNLTITAEDSGTIILGDTTPPLTTITLTGTSGLNDWYVSDVTVTFPATDDLSGVASTEYSFDGTNWIPYTGPITISSEGTTTIYYRSIDNAGNIEGTKSQTIMIDKTPPVISGAPTTSPNAYGWYNADVTIHFVASDIVSGIDYVTPDQTLTAEGADQSIPGMARDIAGNVAYFTVTGINIDKTLPSISGWATVSPNVNGWYKTDVTIHFEATDPLSGIDSITADQTITAEGAAQYVTGTAIDKAGNIAFYTVSGINIDKTPPTITGAPTTLPNVYGWYKTDVTVHFEASDTLSGIDLLTPDQTLTTEGMGQSVVGTARDRAGNEMSYTVSGINIDKTPPVITGAATTSPNAYGWYNTDVVVHFDAGDTLSGIDTITPDQTLTNEGDDQSVQGTAVDKAGNTASFTVNGINIDKTNPVTSLTIGEPKSGTEPTYVSLTTTLTLSAIDGLSGVDYIEYRFGDSGTWTRYTELFTVPGIGSYTLYYRSVDKAGNTEPAQTISIIVNATSITYTGDTAGQYSDPVTVSANLIDMATQLPISGKTISFTIGTQPATATTNNDGIATTSITLNQQAGSYTVSATFAGDSGYLGSSDQKLFTINKEEATVDYTGDTVVPTTTKTINLRATIFDSSDGSWGDLTKIKVTFRIYTAPIDPNNPSVVVGPISVSTTNMPEVGVATAQIPNLPENGYVVIVSIDADDNNYFGGPTSDPIPLTVYEPTGSFTTGGGWTIDPTGSKGNFGFIVRYTKSGQIQGHSVYIYRQGGLDYIVKSNAWIGLAIESTHAYFEGKCTVQIYNPATGELVWSEGNYQFRVDVWDNTPTGGIDVYQIRVLDKNGVLFHEAGFNPFGYLQGGSITIHDERRG